MFSSRNRSPKTKKNRKIADFAAFDERGVRSQKLIKQLNYTRLATVLQELINLILQSGAFFACYSPPPLVPLENLCETGEQAGGLLDLRVALGCKFVPSFQPIDQVHKLDLEPQLQEVPVS